MAVPLVDPVVEWTDRPRQSQAERDGWRLVALRVGGGWAFEIYRTSDRRPMQAGAVAGWTRAHAKDAAVGQLALMLGQSASARRTEPDRLPRRRDPQGAPVPQRLPLEASSGA